jgi:hypothetical protein
MDILLLFTTFLIWSPTFDSMLITNDSQRNIMYIVEYFIDHEKYFYLISLVYTIICIGITVLITVSLMFFVHHKHTCSMFRIVQ